MKTGVLDPTVERLAREFGTPFYVYDAAKIEERIAELKSFDVVRYAMKACSNLAILDFVRRSGVLVGAVGVSGGDSVQDQLAVDAGVRAFSGS